MSGRHQKCIGRFKEYDMFGTDIKFFYKGQEVYTTVFGSVISILAMLAYFSLVVIKMNEFFGMTDPDQYFTETHQSFEEPIGLTELGFSFVVENVPSSYRSSDEDEEMVVELHQVEWNGQTGVKTETQLSLEPCQSPNTELINEYAQTRLKGTTKQQDSADDAYPSYLCPSESAKLVILGNFFEENFTYVRLRVRSKNLLPTTGEVHKLRLYMPRYSVDYEESELDDAIKLMTDSSQVLQIDPYRQQKQDIFFSKSEIDF